MIIIDANSFKARTELLEPKVEERTLEFGMPDSDPEETKRARRRAWERRQRRNRR